MTVISLDVDNAGVHAQVPSKRAPRDFKAVTVRLHSSPLHAVDEPAFQESSRKILASGSKCNCQAKHDGSKSNSEGDQHSLFGDAQFLKSHG